jgi:hypothetical protein
MVNLRSHISEKCDKWFSVLNFCADSETDILSGNPSVSISRASKLDRGGVQ